jgi:hypothetical protein
VPENIFTPISHQEASQENLPSLNFRPLAIRNWYLVTLLIWFFLCFSSLTVLATLGQLQPPWFRFWSDSSFALWLYVPGIIGFITTVLWRGTFQSYNRIIPYVRMANVSFRFPDDKSTNPAGGLALEPLNSIPGGDSINPGILVSLWIRGDYISFVVNLSPLFTLFLTPLKSSLFQLVESPDGWRIRVSTVFGAFGMLIYLWLFSVTLAIFFHLRSNRTGLRWNPATLAAQLSLIQGSNILGCFADIDTSRWLSLNRTIREWPGQGLYLRLGYWKQQGTDLIIHGVRFLPLSDWPRTSQQARDVEQAAHPDVVKSARRSGKLGDAHLNRDVAMYTTTYRVGNEKVNSATGRRSNHQETGTELSQYTTAPLGAGGARDLAQDHKKDTDVSGRQQRQSKSVRSGRIVIILTLCQQRAVTSPVRRTYHHTISIECGTYFSMIPIWRLRHHWVLLV